MQKKRVGAGVVNVIAITISAGCVMLATGCASMAWKEATADNTASAYRNFLSEYPSSEFSREASQRLETLRLQEAQATDNAAVIQRFVTDYPNNRHCADLQLRRDEILYREAKSQGTTHALETYIRMNPSSRYLPDATKSLEALRLEQATKAGTEIALSTFIASASDENLVATARQRLKDLQEKRERSDYEKAKKDETGFALDEFVLRQPQSRFSEEARMLLRERSRALAAKAGHADDFARIEQSLPQEATAHLARELLALLMNSYKRGFPPADLKASKEHPIRISFRPYETKGELLSFASPGMRIVGLASVTEKVLLSIVDQDKGANAVRKQNPNVYVEVTAAAYYVKDGGFTCAGTFIVNGHNLVLSSGDAVFVGTEAPPSFSEGTTCTVDGVTHRFADGKWTAEK